MPLSKLWLDKTPVRDLSPLAGLKLEKLNCRGTHVSDLSVLKDMPLKKLGIENCPIAEPPSPVKSPLSPEQTAVAQRAWANWLRVDVETTNSLGMTFRLIPPGEFTMGSATEEIEAALKSSPEWNKRNLLSEGPARRAAIEQPFYWGTTEVTVGQFRQFVTEAKYETWAEKPGNAGRLFDREIKSMRRRPGVFWNDPSVAQTENHPVVLVHHDDAVAFCEWLSRKDGVTYELPKEAQWEDACRAGSVTPWYWGTEESRIDDFAWWTNPKTHSQGMPVRLKKPNAFGLFDMAGNVSEITIGSDGAIVLRSGNAGALLVQLRSAAREFETHNDPTDRNGFRVLRKLESSMTR